MLPAILRAMRTPLGYSAIAAVTSSSTRSSGEADFPSPIRKSRQRLQQHSRRCRERLTPALRHRLTRPADPHWRLGRYILAGKPGSTGWNTQGTHMAILETPDSRYPKPRKLEDVIASEVHGFAPAPSAPTATSPSGGYVPPQGDQVDLVFGGHDEGSTAQVDGNPLPPHEPSTPPPDPDAPFHGAVDMPFSNSPSSEASPPGPPPRPPKSASAATDDEDDGASDGPPTQDSDLDALSAAEPTSAPRISLPQLPEDEERARLEADFFARGDEMGRSNYVTLTNAANDDPWATEVSDQLGVLPDAKAFARLVVSKKFAPPLAIGVFGPWGAGKSFFMRLVHDHIERLSSGQPSPAAPEADSEAFCDNVVQIRFNAWHYVETNLWASLVDHLFSQLALHVDRDKQPTHLLDQLGTARELTIEAAEALVTKRVEHERAGEVLVAAQKELVAAQGKVKTEPQLYLASLKKALLEDSGTRKLLDDAAETLGLPQFNTEADKAVDAWQSLDNELKSGSVVIGGMTKLFGNYWLLVALLLFGLPFFVAWGLSALKPHISLLAAASPYVAAASTMLATAAALLGKGGQVARGAVEQLRKGMAHIEGAASDLTAKERATVATAAAEAEAAKAKADQARAEFDLASARLAEATEEFYSSTGGQRLIKFIRTRATDGHYASHLGLVASVRRDLEELSRGLDDQKPQVETATDVRTREALEARVEKLVASMGLAQTEVERLRDGLKPRLAVPPPFQRLVLYIDDLDRCPADKVVEVLQAVHMLLAFKLFVVFVAVDVRWVSHALRTHHPGLLSGASEEGSQANPTDYLEKIFQVPYWVRDATGGGADLVASLLPHLPPTPGTPVSPPPARPASVPHVERQALEVTREERMLFERIVPYLASSPRKVLWLINVYRLIKANDEYADELMDDDGARMALITQLVLVSKSPEDFRTWYELLRRMKPGEMVKDVLWEVDLDEGPFASNPRRKQLSAMLYTGFDKLHFNETAQVSLVTLLKYGELAQRYSFALPAIASGHA